MDSFRYSGLRILYIIDSWSIALRIRVENWRGRLLRDIQCIWVVCEADRLFLDDWLREFSCKNINHIEIVFFKVFEGWISNFKGLC